MKKEAVFYLPETDRIFVWAVYPNNPRNFKKNKKYQIEETYRVNADKKFTIYVNAAYFLGWV